jgi:thiamine biosynthesis lipoprotein
MSAYGINAQSALEAGAKRTQELERLWSVTDENSEVYAVNNSDTAVLLSEETLAMLSFAIEMAHNTEGAFDLSIYPLVRAWGFTTGSNQIPSQTELDMLLANVGFEKLSLDGNSLVLPQGMQVDLGAVAKGYTGDLIIELLKEHGITSALVDLGGDIATLGSKPDGSDWRIGIKAPYGDGNIGVLEISDISVVASGGYERYFIGEDGQTYWHIIDPATGKPADNGLISVTIIGKEGKLCDALSTALFVMGMENAIEYWKRNGGFDMILLTGENELIISEGIKDNFTLTEAYRDMAVYVIER